MKRYNLEDVNRFGYEPDYCMVEDIDGIYVEYDEHLAILAVEYEHHKKAERNLQQRVQSCLDKIRHLESTLYELGQ